MNILYFVFIASVLQYFMEILAVNQNIQLIVEMFIKFQILYNLLNINWRRRRKTVIEWFCYGFYFFILSKWSKNIIKLRYCFPLRIRIINAKITSTWLIEWFEFGYLSTEHASCSMFNKGNHFLKKALCKCEN